jgi:hypothetical protein
MRYLAESFAVGALHRGREIEQFLGPWTQGGVAGVRWAEIRPAGPDGFEVLVHAVEDTGTGGFGELWSRGTLPVPEDEVHVCGDDCEEECYEDVNWDYVGRPLGHAETPLAAMELAESETGAVRERWVNRGLADDDYADYVRAGRPGRTGRSEAAQTPA